MKKIEKKILLPSMALLLWMALFSFLNANCQSFWADEIASIGFVRTGISLKEMFETYLYVESNLPFYSLILYFAYRIMPYGEQFLLIPSILFCLLGIIFLAMAAGRLKGKRAGFIALCMGTSSGVLISQEAWEVKCYGLVFLLSAFVLYAYIGKCVKADKKRMILWGGSIALFLWTHWFACVLLAFYGFVDLIMVILRKISWKHLLCYIPGCILFSPWFILSFYYKYLGTGNFWEEMPQWKSMFWTVLFYLDGNRIFWYLCLVTGVAILICAVYQIRRPYSEEKVKIYLAASCVIAVGWVIGIIFLFSRYIRPEFSLYVERYFTVIQPHILLITTLGLDFCLDIADRMVRENGIKKRIFSTAAAWFIRVTVIVLLSTSFIVCYRNEYIVIRKPFQQYREAADYLIEEGNIWDETTLFIASNKWCMLDGFIDYYFEKRGYKPPANIADSMVHREQESRFYRNYTEISMEEMLSYERIYCLRIHMGIDENLEQFLMKYYEKVREKDENGIEVWERIEDTKTGV